jgi:hypothetical protein
MDKVMRLDSQNGYLELEHIQNHWYQVRFYVNAALVLQAHERHDYLLLHFIRLLEKQNGDVFPYENLTLAWVMSLSEPHRSIYCADEPEGIALYFEKAGRLSPHVLRLSSADMTRWKNQVGTTWQ